MLPSRSLALCLFAAAMIGSFARAASDPPADSRAGELIYREGKLASDRPLHGRREGNQLIAGADAACGNCHRRSGLGTVEGRIVMPPINSRSLFHPGTHEAAAKLGETSEALRGNRGAYSDATLARALRQGLAADGRVLDPLMPRFDLDPRNMAALLSYLHGLGADPVPGVEDERLHFATIITPDADPIASGAMVNVLEQFFATRNASYRGESPPLQSARRIHFRVLRQWQLHVWRLHGPPGTWEVQLDHHLQHDPVFAVISGIGRTTWEPVHHFCERQAIPCLLPNVDLPVVNEKDFYPVYFSQGVLLEARMLAYRFAASPPFRRVVQVYRPDDIGAQAAAAFRAAAGTDFVVEDRSISPSATGADLAKTIAVHSNEVLVLWLRSEDIGNLPQHVEPARLVFASGIMGGLEAMPLPHDWRDSTEFTYPFELPALRRVRMNYPLGWFAIRHIPLLSERVQTDTYLACEILAEALGTMRDDFVRDYLVERIEVMLSARLLNGYYTRLGLAPGQRFASKGGYFVHFADPMHESAIIADGPWTIPWKRSDQALAGR